MSSLKNIEVLIRVLERLKTESPEFQEDALWKLGNFITEAVDQETTLEEHSLFERLRDFHLRIEEMAAEG
ncbi:hypothetical protein Mesil_0558 [Allomeiothermus silvanus DSM 9946]|uniref:Uncharacterized protein n=1 Tax=Allomeiothermus silvanus (strain ATCC 700542 / DSM 9946 / NBRC 106475 / NCIMB 13440 / VI-R2) TaxID=526227 RepID=D7BA53_ALLS1|nr:hypothetical protein [Allomeiothermus silvanus]ADH62487.1 hypothetical protein Mesil_0558 [Allomeiothermus silvanus DSM 9946]